MLDDCLFCSPVDFTDVIVRFLLIVGVIIGAYSSIYVANGLLMT